jgi:hypothetical protein
MLSSRGLPNITHQPLLESLKKTHDNKHTLTSQNFRYKILELHIHSHMKHTIAKLCHSQDPCWSSSFPIRLLHLVFNYIRLKDVRHSENNLSFIKLQPSTPSCILSSIATRYYSLFKTLMHTIPTKIKEQQTTRNLIFSSSLYSKPERCPPCRTALLHICTAPHPSEIPTPIVVTFTRIFMKNKNQPR